MQSLRIFPQGRTAATKSYILARTPVKFGGALSFTRARLDFASHHARLAGRILFEHAL
jgi:hypothetical protein